MRKILIVIVLIVLGIFTYLYFKDKSDQRIELAQATELIEKETKEQRQKIHTTNT